MPEHTAELDAARADVETASEPSCDFIDAERECYRLSAELKRLQSAASEVFMRTSRAAALLVTGRLLVCRHQQDAASFWQQRGGMALSNVDSNGLVRVLFLATDRAGRETADIVRVPIEAVIGICKVCVAIV